MEHLTSEFATILALIIGLAAAYGKAFGPYQERITQAVIDAVQVPSRFRALTNIGVGLLLSTAFTLVIVQQLGEWKLLSVGLLAGLVASVNASKEHDAQTNEPTYRQTVLKGVAR